ncbi:type I-F CRISPR-associated protein Csy1 [Ostreibacterium oceani]|uniref:Type I-F CRISPR-associated protein Csy1 n=1 Tax=Ostreibacterium oceani TaxID=2654998 RepID=A0A6N7EWW2_9GAMM|nr:type I-F CRISPR-associated protein Csy1 [Ostreibacterium oceani]MPV85909.1 type I-F CRISPR-associated protein Csy1 [Ostreibacterium oceani]
MIDDAITTFLDDRKDAWLKKNISSSMNEEEITEKELECETIFTLQHWLPNAAKRAGQMSMSSHPCTFSHPSSRKNKNGYATSVIANSKRSNDGFLRSGNVTVELDALGNAAALDVYKFLTLKMNDGMSLIEHIEKDTELAVKLLTLSNVNEELNYLALKKDFLEMVSVGSEIVTSSKIKQVFFPIEKDWSENKSYNAESYHQLSILTASGILFELRNRLDAMRFGDEIKFARESKRMNQKHPGFKEIYNLTTIGYGGTKPQNISVLNNKNGGKAHMFMSVPPKLKQRDIHFPQTDFFRQTVHYFQCKNQFYQLHKLYSRENNNKLIRDMRDEYYQSIIDHIIEKMWQIRSVATEQFSTNENQLPLVQKIWLCDQLEYSEQREKMDDWLVEIEDSIAKFLFHGYEKVLGKNAIKLSDEEYKHMHKKVFSNREALR